MLVEPTRSQNITVRCRRSPAASATAEIGGGAAAEMGVDTTGVGGAVFTIAGTAGALFSGFEVDNRAQHFAPITEKDA